MATIRVNFKYGTVIKPDDGKTCRNCLEYHTSEQAKAICLECTRFGHTDGKKDNWQPGTCSDAHD